MSSLSLLQVPPREGLTTGVQGVELLSALRKERSRAQKDRGTPQGTHPIVLRSVCRCSRGHGEWNLCRHLHPPRIGRSLRGRSQGHRSDGPAYLPFSEMVSLGILTGMSLGWIREKTKLEVWGILGGIIGTLAGALLCLIYEIVVAMVTVGVFRPG